ncbi:DNA internalization-related competence protein ComEC/Rec2 [Ralstonia pickettii]|nr:DNA internalization-related competence protein ComEC/Rec2 [Ralstonia pickettii]
MKGYWHITALAAVFAAISVMLNYNLFSFILLWLLFLFYEKRIPLLTFLLSIFCFFFFYQHIPELENNPPAYPPQASSQTYTGKIISEPVINSKKIEFIVEEKRTAEKIMILFFPNDGVPDDKVTASLKYGATCELSGVIEQPDGARNPGQFDNRKFLLTKGISYQMIVNDLQNVKCNGASFWQRFFTLRLNLIEQAKEKLSSYTSSWVNALVLGDDSEIDDGLIELFQNWGLSHLLAISGLHIGIIVGIMYFILIKLNLLTREKTELVMLLFLPVYAILAGGEPSVLRASMMVLLILIFRRFMIHMYVLDIISIVFLILLTFDEYMIYHIGFQFSFLVTFGILLSRKWLFTVNSSILQLLIISFVSQMIILPLQLNYFSLFQPLSILLNLIIVPYFSIFVIPFMFFFLIASFLPQELLRVFDDTFVVIHQYAMECIDFIDRYFNFPFLLSGLPVWFFIVYYLLLLLSQYLLEFKRLKQAFISFFCLTLLLTGYASIPYFSGKGYVTMLDIGQGDAFIVELPYRKGVFMIDAGSRFSFTDMEPANTVYKQIILPYLKSRGIHKLDGLFLTHEDMDHIGSAGFMVEGGLVEALYVSEFFLIPDDLANKSAENNVPVHHIQAGDVLHLGGQQLIVLAPIHDKQDPNENSLVLYTDLGGKSWLFTGDIGKEEEIELLSYYSLKADVLKVAHHGSSTSSDPTFIERITPKTALISVGVNNSYGHPTMEVLHTLKAFQIQILRTDLHGAVQYQYLGEQGDFHTYLPTR